MTDRSIPQATTTPKLPPRWFIRAAWVVHRAIHRFTGGRRGLAHPKGPGGNFGLLRLKTVGRRSGTERAAIIGYVEDGANLVTLAMNGWDEKDPAWWLNLRAQPDATVELKGGANPRRARSRGRWARSANACGRSCRAYRGYGDLDGFAQRRSQTAVVVLEPRP